MSRFSRAQIDGLLTRNPLAVLDYEIAQERASALGRLGRRLEAALAELRAHDADQPDPDGKKAERDDLIAEAVLALWEFIVQRESCGLRDSNRVMVDYGVPTEVRARLGVFPANRFPAKNKRGRR